MFLFPLIRLHGHQSGPGKSLKFSFPAISRFVLNSLPCVTVCYLFLYTRVFGRVGKCSNHIAVCFFLGPVTFLVGAFHVDTEAWSSSIQRQAFVSCNVNLCLATFPIRRCT